MDNIEWRSIPGYEGLYEVSSNGDVKSLKYRKTENYGLLKQEINHDGYCRVVLSGYKRFSVHRLVAIAFLDKIDGLNIINHKNGIRNDNRIENLEWCTSKYNAIYSYKVLKRKPPWINKKGGKCPFSKKCISILSDKHRTVYSSAHEASRITGINCSSIIQVCNHKRKTAGGFIWEWY